MGNLIIKEKGQLPVTVEKLNKFIVYGKVLLDAQIKALREINKLETSIEAKEAKLHDTQKAAILLLEAEQKLGAMLEAIPKEDSYTGFQARKAVLPKGITHKQSHYAQTVSEHPEIVEKVIEEAIEKGAVPTTKEVLKEVAKEKRAKEIQEIEAKAIEKPTGLYDVIIIDPPWKYGTKYDPNTRRIASPYPEMEIEDIKNINIPADENCILWLWTTHKFMRHSFCILDHWGFRDVAILTWIKDKIGIGTWLRSQSEFCIMAVKGEPKTKLTNQSTILHGKAREHSRKPDEFYNMVNSLCIGRKLDYFSREKREGFDSYGNEPEKFRLGE